MTQVPGITTQGRIWKRTCRITMNGHMVAEHFDEGDHRIAFEVERHNRIEPNKGRVQIYGLSQANRDLIRKRFDQARQSVLDGGGSGSVGDLVVEAGYDGNVEQLSKMDIVDIEQEPLDPGWVLNIEAQDGVLPFANSIVNESIAPGVDVNVVKTVLASAMKVAFLDADSEKEFQTALSEFSARQVQSGMVLQGPARQVMTDLLDSMDLAWSFQDGKLRLLRFDGTTTDHAVLLSPDSGLKEVGVRFRNLGRANVLCFLNPKLHPGRQVSIVDGVGAPQGAGIFRVDRVHHVGDTQEGPWDSNVDVRPSTLEAA